MHVLKVKWFKNTFNKRENKRKEKRMKEWGWKNVDVLLISGVTKFLTERLFIIGAASLGAGTRVVRVRLWVGNYNARAREMQ